jgi:Family of unknown function (DUF6455)
LIWRNVALADWSNPGANRIETVLAKLLNRIQNKARLMGAMMARVGVDPVEAARIRGGTALAAAGRRCMACQNGEDCAAWLESAPSHAEPPAFCPNAAVFAEARVRPASWPAPSRLFVVHDNTPSGERPA